MEYNRLFMSVPWAFFLLFVSMTFYLSAPPFPFAELPSLFSNAYYLLLLGSSIFSWHSPYLPLHWYINKAFLLCFPASLQACRTRLHMVWASSPDFPNLGFILSYAGVFFACFACFVYFWCFVCFGYVLNRWLPHPFHAPSSLIVFSLHSHIFPWNCLRKTFPYGILCRLSRRQAKTLAKTYTQKFTHDIYVRKFVHKNPIPYLKNPTKNLIMEVN